jgi:hypothetical protein
VNPIAYKIRDKDTGLYAISLSRNKWGKIGRTWSRLSDVTRVINLGVSSKPGSDISYREWLLSSVEIIELQELRSYSTTYIIDKIK